ncbi:MAG: lipopolysaccharide biosynthesis protein [Actinomycetota bacterium]|nr:lipopolysaccharide biosynthesis protein [Actinomycetota bacterium]
MANLEFGFGNTAVRFLAHARARRDAADEQAVISNALLIFVPAAALAFALPFFGAPFVVSHFAHGPRSLHRVFLTAVRLGAAIVAIALITSLWSAALQALGRFAWLINTNWIFGTMLSASSVLIAATGGGILNVLRAQLAILSFLSLADMIALSRSTSAHLVPRMHSQTFREMAGFARQTFAAGLGSQVLAQGPPAILAGYGTTAELAFFALPRTVMQQVDGLVGSTSLGFFPFTSAASAEPDKTRVIALFRSNMRLTLLLLAPFSCFIAAFAHPLLVAWIGGTFAERTTLPLQFFAGASLFWGLGSAPADVARGFGRPGLVSAYTAAGAITALALSFLLIPDYGASGAACAVCVSGAFITVPFIFVSASEVLGLRAIDLLKSLIGPITALALAAAISVGGALLADTFLSAVLTGTALAVLYLSFVARRVLWRREREVLKSLLVRSPSPQTPDAEARRSGTADDDNPNLEQSR